MCPYGRPRGLWGPPNPIVDSPPVGEVLLGCTRGGPFAGDEYGSPFRYGSWPRMNFELRLSTGAMAIVTTAFLIQGGAAT